MATNNHTSKFGPESSARATATTQIPERHSVAGTAEAKTSASRRTLSSAGRLDSTEVQDVKLDAGKDEWVFVEKLEEKVMTVEELDKWMQEKTCPVLLAKAKKEVEDFDGVA